MNPKIEGQFTVISFSAGRAVNLNYGPYSKPNSCIKFVGNIGPTYPSDSLLKPKLRNKNQLHKIYILTVITSLFTYDISNNK